MTLWFILGAMSAVTVAALFFGLRRGTDTPAARADYDLTVYRSQLGELERDLKRGVLDRAELDSARLEIERRILAADAARRDPTPIAGRPARALSLAAILLVPAGAFGLYLWLGNPGVESLPFAERTAEAPAGGAGRQSNLANPANPADLPDVATMVAGLRDRLAENPDDVEGWVMLGRSSQVLGRIDEAIVAYGRALALDPRLSDIRSSLGEAQVMAAGGVIVQEARRAFEQALALNPNDARARFYLALAREQDGDLAGALDALAELLADTPPEAPWAEGVVRQAATIAEALGLDPQAVLPAGLPAVGTALKETPGPEAADGLAARLEANPKDYQGWIALARLRAALDDPEGARAALDRGAEAYAGAPFVQQQLRQAAVELGLEAPAGGQRGPSAADIQAATEMSPEDQGAMIRGMVVGLAARLEREPDDLVGWRMLARSYAVLGEPEKAAEAYGRVADLRPGDMGAQLDHAMALIDAAGEGAPPPPAAVATLEKVVARDPLNLDALYYLGDAAARTGDGAGAALYWQRLLDQLPPESEEHAWIKSRIAALSEAGATSP